MDPGVYVTWRLLQLDLFYHREEGIVGTIRNNSSTLTGMAHMRMGDVEIVSVKPFVKP
jgi:hypothetical protein